MNSLIGISSAICTIVIFHAVICVNCYIFTISIVEFKYICVLCISKTFDHRVLY